jgi:hypothetical protein
MAKNGMTIACSERLRLGQARLGQARLGQARLGQARLDLDSCLSRSNIKLDLLEGQEMLV